MSATGTLAAQVEALCGDLSAIRAPRGTELNARSWQTEAPLRMLLNNLDPEVAEHPEQLVVYGGIGQGCAQPRGAARRSCARCCALGDDETLLVQSGKPVGVFRDARGRAARADRELAARARAGRRGTSSAASRRSG